MMTETNTGWESEWVNGFGPLLRGLRQRKGLGLSQLAIRVQCAKSHLSSLETGARQMPGDELIKRLEDELGVPRGKLALAADLASLGPAGRAHVVELERQADGRAYEARQTPEQKPQPVQGLAARGLIDLAAMPAGAEVLSDGDLAPWMQSTMELRGVGVEAKGSLALRIGDEAMSPELARGDVVMLGEARGDKSKPAEGLCAVACRFGCGVLNGVVVRRVVDVGVKVRLEPGNVFMRPVEMGLEWVLWWAPVVAHIRVGQADASATMT